MPGNIEFILNNAPQCAAKRISTDSDKTVLSQQLLHLVFDDNQYRKLLSKGTVLIKAVIGYFEALTNLKFTQELIFNIAAHNGGAKALAKHFFFIQSFSRGGLFYTINPNVQMYAGYS